MISKDAIFNIKTHAEFEALALNAFRFQFENNSVYRSFCDLLYRHPSDVKHLRDIPFLPIQFFKTHEVLSSQNKVEKIFTSSGTTGSVTSKHLVTDLNIYEESYLKGFQHFYGNVKDYVILALLPSYLEREGSSLIYMVNDLIQKSKHPESGFYLNNLQDLSETLKQLEANGQKTLLIGVSFALLDVVEQFQFNLKHTIVMETGGMKGRRKEIIRQELHDRLKGGFGVNHIHSEYGMTELLSQAYSKGNGIFDCPPWMKIIIRDTEDALTILPPNKTGGLNIIDLANINSCSFIASQDLGKTSENGQFEIIGRFDNSDIRGCNLMAL
ncbi:acyl transferase [Winogradskyella sp. J14-2]|uniref:LuxE/PaaK family acyltransferase n=1 Tax=Winogradskyella sp. J14-2 TaxID=1936080 RepID=UPI000972E8EC|nr:acyl transferase [Winogradskyella sp. J14-2]APY08122.1 acyl transferase [Winogradskyella sp. J14-2]